jgi:hypothetical protein
MTLLPVCDLDIARALIASVSLWQQGSRAAPRCRRTGGKTMAQFSVNPNRHDPYKQFKFRVRMEGRIVAGVAKVGALHRSTEVIESAILRCNPRCVRIEWNLITCGGATSSRSSAARRCDRWRRARWSVGCITNTLESEFSAHTGGEPTEFAARLCINFTKRINEYPRA